MGEERGKGALRAALRHRDFRYLLAGLAISQVGDWLYGVALIVFVFNVTHSPGWVAAAAICRLIPFMILAPFGGVVADRYERRSVMIVSDLVLAALMFVLATAAALTESVVLAIAIAIAGTVAGTPYGPATAAMTPAVVGEDDLASANAISSVVENIALAVGPAIGGILLLLGSPVIAFASNGVTFLLSALCVAAIKVRSSPSEEGREASMVERVAEGLRAIVTSAEIVMLIVVITGATILYGQESVLLVLVARNFLGLGSEGVGFLMGAIGIGGILVAGLTSRFAQDPRPGRTLAVALVVSGASLMVLAFVRTPVLAFAAMTLDGAGAIVIDVVAITMLQRILSQDLIGRVFGVLDTLAVAGLLIGSLAAPILLNAFGLSTALIIAGATLPVIAFLLLPRLRAMDEKSAARVREVAPRVELLSRLGVFQGASRQALEMIARTVTEQRVTAGQAVVREGDVADDFFVVRSGAMDVFSSGEAGGAPIKVNSLTEGDYFGEIGLLEGIPRTATVEATTDSVVYRIKGEDFLSVVNQAPSMSGTLLDGVVGRLARTHPSRQAAVAERAEA